MRALNVQGTVTTVLHGAIAFKLMDAEMDISKLAYVVLLALGVMGLWVSTVTDTWTHQSVKHATLTAKIVQKEAQILVSHALQKIIIL